MSSLYDILLTGRISNPQRAGAGAVGSWSWTESNFHPDDVMDSSYTDPSYKPVYTLEGFSPNMVNTGKIRCLVKVPLPEIH